MEFISCKSYDVKVNRCDWEHIGKPELCRLFHYLINFTVTLDIADKKMDAQLLQFPENLPLISTTNAATSSNGLRLKSLSYLIIII